MRRELVVLVALASWLIAAERLAAWVDPAVSELVAQARLAIAQKKPQEAKGFADRAIEISPMSREALSMRAVAHSMLGQYAEAVADYTRVIEIGPESARLYDARGGEQFKAGKIAESIADFTRAVELEPERAWGHWQRGISYYYAGKYDDGKRQFEAYQLTDDNDVENAVWRFLCMARAKDVAAARADILKIRDDPRVPMKQIYALYAGQATPEDVLAAAKAGNPSAADLNSHLFYAHLYLGLFAEANGDVKLAQEHLTTAAEKHKIGHYMWDVARVHAELLKKAASSSPK